MRFLAGVVDSGVIDFLRGYSMIKLKNRRIF